MEHFYQNLGENWFTYPNLYRQAVEHFPTNSHFVEVGVWKGRSAAFMAVEIINSGKEIKFDCVDNWEYSDIQTDIAEAKYENLYETFLNNIEPVKHIINPIRKLSYVASTGYKDNSLDFVFIDAAHDYDNVLVDLKAWAPKIKSNGIIAGHDYAWGGGVKKAVNEFFGKDNIQQQEGCWIYKNQ